MTSLVGAITLLDPLDVLAGKVILKMEKINAQVTLSNPLIETLRYSYPRLFQINFLCSKWFFTKFAALLGTAKILRKVPFL